MIGDRSGYSVAIDGKRIAIGALENGGKERRSDHVRVHQWTDSAWVQLGRDIDGEAADDKSSHSVILDGDRLVVGAPRSKGAAQNANHVRVYDLPAQPSR